MKNSRSVKFAVRMGMMTALLIAGELIRASDQTGADGPEKSSDKGLTPNASITSISGLEIDTYRMNVMYNLPFSPSFKVADGVSYGVTGRYSSNIFSQFATYAPQGTTIPYIPTLHSPFGTGIEFGFGVIYLDYRPGKAQSEEIIDFHRSWTLQTPDGSTHQLYFLATSGAGVDPAHTDGFASVPGEPLGAHVRSDTFAAKTSANISDTWTEFQRPEADFVTLDGSLIKAKYHQATALFGSSAFWEIFYPDGRRVVFGRQFTPAGHSLQESYYQRCGAVNLNTALPQEMTGWYPTRVENSRQIGFNLFYEDPNPNYGYLVTRISDDTDRKNFGGQNADIRFTVMDINGAGRYTAISYPGANGALQTVNLTYYAAQPALYRYLNGTAIAAGTNPFPGEFVPSSFSTLTLTLLKEIQMPGGYVQKFSYFDESGSGNDRLASGRLRRIELPTGGAHEFTYQVYLFKTSSSEAELETQRLSIASHTLKVRDGASAAPDLMTWTYQQDPPVFVGGTHYDVRNGVTDPAGNETVYRFNGSRGSPIGDSLIGTLAQTEFYQGPRGPAGNLRKVVKNEWRKFSVSHADPVIFTDPEKPQIVKTTTEFHDDPVANAPGTLIEENLGWDYWGHFTTKQTSGTLVPKMRRTVTAFSLEKTRIVLDQEPFNPANLPLTVAREPGPAGSCSQTNSVITGVQAPAFLAHLTVPGCDYLSGAMANWRLSLPLSVELQEWNGTAWETKSRAETRYDLASGLPTRTIARKSLAGAVTDSCTAMITPQPGDVVSDFYYDSRGNLALKKVHGADDTAVFRTYMGTGDKPAAGTAPTAPAVIGPDASEPIYPFGIPASDIYVGSCAENGTHCYFGFDRWSREFNAAETAPHRFVNSFVDATAADMERISGAIIQSHDANQMSSKTEYDSIGRVSRKTFLGDGNPGSGDKPVDYTYVDIDVGGGVKQLVSLKSVQEDTAKPEQRIETQDYYDGLGRKVISRRLNPDGQFAYQVMHYDEIGHADLVSNWSFFPPPGVDFNGAVLDATLWTDVQLRNYILSTVGAYTRSCYRPACGSGAGTYEFAGRPLRTERIAQQGAELISRVDTEYFGFNTRVKTYGLNSTNATAPGAITTHYTDGYGNLREVDVDEGGSGGGQGVDAIYDYDYANRLIKVNLVTEAAISPFLNGGDRYATSNGDNQTRFFTFDSLGRQTEANNQENGITKYLKFNALGQVLEAEDENGRIGGGPSGGTVDESAAPAPIGICLAANEFHCIPSVKIITPLVAAGTTGGELDAHWTATGKIRTSPQGAPPVFQIVPAGQLYYQATLDGQIVVPWTLSVFSYATTGLAAGTHSLVVQAAYEVPGDLPVGSDQRTFTNAANPDAYRLSHQYDSRGREIAVNKVTPAGALLSALRQFTYESGTTGCAQARSCGKLTQAVSKRAGTSDVVQSFAFRAKDGRMVGQALQAEQLSSYPTYSLAFDYDGFGRQDLATYPDGKQIKLIFQSGGVKSVNQVEGAALTPYATMGRLGDYHEDGSLAVFLQGNGLTFHRYLDGAERVSQLCYNDFPSNPPFLANCLGTPREAWNSGGYLYDGVGNIRAIGNDQFTHDRLNRLKSATLNRHPHALQPAGFVNMSYDYDMYGNITKRFQTNTAAGVPYLAGSDPAERFGATTARDYTNGPGAPDNKIHDLGFAYDGNGNLVSDGKKDFIYDELNQQIEVHEKLTTGACTLFIQNLPPNLPPVALRFLQRLQDRLQNRCYGMGPLVEENIYGPDGMRAVRRVTMTTQGATVNRNTVYTRLGGNVVEENTEEPNPAAGNAFQVSHHKSYIYGPLGLLATEELCSFNCTDGDVANALTTRYYEYDHLGTIRAITTSTGALQSTFDYEPFGLELKGTTVSFTDTSSNTHRFTGHERDEEAGEDYMKARMYVLSTARFPQIDPMFGGAGNPQNWNAYIYVGNSPVGASDPTGMMPILGYRVGCGEGGGCGGPSALIAAASSFNPLTASGPSYSACAGSSCMHSGGINWVTDTTQQKLDIIPANQVGNKDTVMHLSKFPEGMKTRLEKERTLNF